MKKIELIKKIRKLEKKLEQKGGQEKKRGKNHGFRLQGRHLFLTYSQIGTKIDEPDVKKQLDDKLGTKKIEKYAIVKEKHQDGGEHIHAYIKLDSVCNIKSADRLDIIDNEGKKYHGKYETCRSYTRVVHYMLKNVKKKEEIYTNMDLKDDGREKNIWRDIVEKVEEGNIEEGLEILKSGVSRTYAVDYGKLTKNFKMMRADAVAREKKQKTSYALEDFDVPKSVIEWFKKGLINKTLFLTGASGIGKTEMIKALAKEKVGEKHVIRVTDIEGLKNVNENHKFLILDDVNIAEKPMELKIALVDVENDVDIKILYQSKELTAELSRAIITNLSFNDYFGIYGMTEQTKAILRRINPIDLKNHKVILRKRVEVEEIELVPLKNDDKTNNKNEN